MDLDVVECELGRIVITEEAQSPHMILLREKGGSRELPIYIGDAEVLAIKRHVAGMELPRPLTHDLLINTIEALDGKIDHVIVSDLKIDQIGQGTYYGLLVIDRKEGGRIAVDARPSDCIAVATRLGCRVFVAEHVLDGAS